MPRLSPASLLTVLALIAPMVGAQTQSKEPPPLGTASFTPPEGNTQLQPLTRENFVTRAAVVNMAEIELSQLALTKSSDAAVRGYATGLIKDHQAAQAKLKAIATGAKIAMPGTVDEEHRKQREQLKGIEGAKFDQQYVAAMRTGHEQAIKLLQSAGQSNELDASLKQYASDLLATVEAHRTDAEKLHAKH